MSNFNSSFDDFKEEDFDDWEVHVHGAHSNTPVGCTSTPNLPVKSRKIKVLFDWFGFTFSYDFWTVQKVQEFLNQFIGIPLDGWAEGRKNYEGYGESIEFEHIIIYYNGTEEQGIHIDITGQGCRFSEVMFTRLGVDKYNWYNVIEGVVSGGGKFSRIDVAIDDHDGMFVMRDVFFKLLEGEITTKFHSWRPGGDFDFNKSNKGLTLYFGSKQSDFTVCMYEKNKQLALKDVVWNRIELRYKRKRAVDFSNLLLSMGGDHYKDLGVIAAGVLKEYIKFREPSNDSNKRRWKVSPWWEEFLEGVEPLRVASALPDRTVYSIHEWLSKSVSKSIAMLLFAYRGIDDKWMDKLIKEGLSKVSAKDRIIVEEFRRLYEFSLPQADIKDVDISD
ncbi:replication initiation factor domain-containing protein [Brevibacillus reuszeri]|uniref:replication initiation factor domain-containing protein n=1 Tax=Brevibacillus reuszeri TaxID=54915 RepID=UPI000CCC378A|nr:replication initiation factor domain-containing protein [Brevibacillus reuszeri]